MTKFDELIRSERIRNIATDEEGVSFIWKAARMVEQQPEWASSICLESRARVVELLASDIAAQLRDKLLDNIDLNELKNQIVDELASRLVDRLLGDRKD